jgi:hypothetical protein
MKMPWMTYTAALVALVLAGCGSSNSSSSTSSAAGSTSASTSSTSSAAPSAGTFKSGFSTDRVQFRTLGLDLRKEITTAQTKTDAQLATEIAALAVRAKQQAALLSQLSPPAKYQSALQRLVTAFNAVAVDLQKISVAATKNDGPAAKAATETLIRDSAKVKTTDDAITTGLKLPANG